MKKLLSLALVFVLACGSEKAAEIDSASEVVVQAEQSLAHKYLIVDTHIDVPYRLFKSQDSIDVSLATDDGQFDFPRARAGGLDALFMSIYIPAAKEADGTATAFANESIDRVENLVTHAPDKFAIATCTDDVARIKTSGKVAFPMGMENGAPIAGDLDLLDHFVARGIRYITLAHSKWNHIADSSYDEDEHWGGLSPFGRELVVAMNESGVMVDISHVTDNTFWQVLELTKVPVIASHSSLRHFTPGFHRNMSDEMVEALGAQGGVIQINFGSTFITKTARDYADAATLAYKDFQEQGDFADDAQEIKDFRAQYLVNKSFPFASIDDVLDHIDRAVELAGIAHVGLGSDYDGVGDSLPIGLKDVSAYPNLVAGLVDRGYAKLEIEQILGGNLMRVWKEVEAYASSKGHPANCTQSSCYFCGETHVEEPFERYGSVTN